MVAYLDWPTPMGLDALDATWEAKTSSENSWRPIMTIDRPYRPGAQGPDHLKIVIGQIARTNVSHGHRF